MMRVTEENEGVPQGARLERYTEFQAEKRLRDISVYCAFVNWCSTGAAKENVYQCLTREFGIYNRKTLYNTIERGRKYNEEIMGDSLKLS